MTTQIRHWQATAIRFVAALALALATNAAVGAPDDGAVLARVSQEKLAQSPAWLALLHYRPLANGGWRSEADQAGFFLSEHGKDAPDSELVANLAALLADDGTTYACRFPARYEWLRQRLALARPADATIGCPALRHWFGGVDGAHISINFAASYMESPSSMFGHTFLKTDAGGAASVLNPTINYSAKTAAREGDLDFIRKGLFGGFPGVADELPFYRRLRSYAEIEGRDIWEYDLTLNHAEIRQLLLHTWEIKDEVFDYFFLDENCAYRTLSLIDVARPGQGLLDGFRSLTIPIETIRTLQARGLIGATRSWPAFPRLIRQHERALPADQVHQASAIAAGLAPPQAIAHLAPARQADILHLAFEYLSLQINRDNAERANAKTILESIVQRRLLLDQPSSLNMATDAVAPQLGHASGQLVLGGYTRAGETGMAFTLAGFQHTQADRRDGFAPFSEIVLLRPELHWAGGHSPRLEQMTWLYLQSTIPASALFAPRAWRVDLATGRQPFIQADAMATHLAYATGRAWSFEDTVLTVMPAAQLELAAPLAHRVAAGAGLALLVDHQGRNWSARLGIDSEKFLLGAHLWRHTVRADAAFELGPDWALVLAASQTRTPWRAARLFAGVRRYIARTMTP